ncbi:MAG TPA: NAD-dependent epimerase/dehydratase family protein [Acidimicrobiales bacterium]
MIDWVCKDEEDNVNVSKQLHVLVLGGTKFVGRAVSEAALELGYRVTLFNRGLTNADLFDGAVEKVHGDRQSDLGSLAGRTWDAIIDVAAYHPTTVARSLEALADSVERYLFVSTVSVYADQSIPPVEGAPVLELEDPSDETPLRYGARKAACEELVTTRLGERSTIVRPGLIVGPHDPTERFSYWPRRIAEGGVVLAPGDPTDPLQFIDVRDLGRFMLRLVQDNRSGTFNATGATMDFAALVEACRRVCASDVEVVWVPSQKLLEAGLTPWMGVPLWIGDPAWKGANRVDISRALQAGLEFRDLDDTIKAALDSEPPDQRTTFDSSIEKSLLQSLA